MYSLNLYRFVEFAFKLPSFVGLATIQFNPDRKVFYINSDRRKYRHPLFAIFCMVCSVFHFSHQTIRLYFESKKLNKNRNDEFNLGYACAVAFLVVLMLQCIIYVKTDKFLAVLNHVMSYYPQFQSK